MFKLFLSHTKQLKTSDEIRIVMMAAFQIALLSYTILLAVGILQVYIYLTFKFQI